MHQIIQDRYCIAFCQNKAQVTQKRFNILQQKARERKVERKLNNQALESGDIYVEGMVKTDHAKLYIAQKCKVYMMSSVTANPAQKEKCIETKEQERKTMH